MSESVSCLRSGGGELSVCRLGDGRQITMLHGGPGLDHHVLLPLARSLSRGFEVWLPDLPGHGASPPTHGVRPGLRETVAALESWLAGLPEGPGVLLGHSFGAWLVRKLLSRAIVHPVAAILLSPLAVSRGDPGGRIRGPVRDRDAGVSSRDILRAHIESECDGVVPEDLGSLLEAAKLRSVGEYAELTRVLEAELKGSSTPFRPSCPVLVASGDRDRTTPLDHMRSAARSLVGAESVVFGRTGHYPFLEDPEVVAGTVRSFVERVDPVSEGGRRAIT